MIKIEYKVIIEGNLMGANEYIRLNRTNYYLANNKKKEQELLIYYSFNQQIKNVQFHKIELEIKWIEKDKRRDPDNFCFGLKWILDSMQKHQYIKNDGWNEIKTIQHSWAVDKQNPRVEIIIREVS